MFVTQLFWTFADARRTGIFLWKDCVINFYDSVKLLLPFITLLSAFFVFSEMEKYKQISILQLKGISEFNIFKIFIVFGFIAFIFSLLTEIFVPYPGEISGKRKDNGPVCIIGDRIFFWIEKMEGTKLTHDVIIVDQKGNQRFYYYAKRAELLDSSIALHDGSITYPDGKIKKFDRFLMNVNFNPCLLVKYIQTSVEREPFLELNKMLNNASRLGIEPRSDWIVLYSKISYACLNIFIVLLLFPFFCHKKILSRTKVFIVGFILTLMSYSFYTAGLSLGKAEIIPWQFSPFIAHSIIICFFSIYLLFYRKKMYNI